jgi:translation initiation factor 1A
MPKGNTVGGKAYKKNKTGRVKKTNEMMYAEDDPSYRYALVVKKLGGSRLEININEGEEGVHGNIRGALYKKVYMNPGDVILVSARDDLTDDHVYDILHKFTPDQTSLLRRQKLISFDEKKENNVDGIMFGDDNGSDDDSDIDLNDI